MNTKRRTLCYPLNRALSVLLSLFIILTVFPQIDINVNADERSGKCGDNLTWTLDGGALTISGAGDMYDYTTDTTEPDSPWYAYKDEIISLNVENGVTSIGGAAFFKCSSLTNVSLPDSVKYIGNYSFNGTGIVNDKTNYENGVLYVGKHLIKADDSSLPSSYTIKSGTVTIAGGAFSSCTGLAEITIADTVETICDYAFYFCPGLTTLTVPQNVSTICERAFGDCARLETLDIKSGVKTIGAYSFSSCLKLKELKIPDSVKTLEEAAFCNCTSLESIDFGAGLQTIGASAFYNCTALGDLTVPGNVAFIGDGAFYGCYGTESAIMESGVKTIGGYAFYGCEILETVTIPNSVRDIGTDAFGGCGGVCIKCGNESKALEYATDNEIRYEIISEPVVLKNGICGDGLTWAFDDNGKMLISGSGKMNDFVYSSDAPWYLEKDDISSVIISDGVTTVSDWAFSFCSGIKKIVIPDSVTSIGYKTFCGCGITEIFISKNIESLGSFAFACHDVRSITVDENNRYYSSDERGALFNKDKTTLIQYPLGNYEYEYTIPGSVNTIGSWAFEGCAYLEKVIIPGSVRIINYRAFSSCKLLSQVIMANGITEIGDVAFFDCKNLYAVTLPQSVSTIGFAAFGFYSDNGNKKIHGFTVSCFERSAAMQYATDNGFACELIANGIVISNVSVYKDCGSFLCGVAPSTSFKQFENQFISSVTIKDRKGSAVTDGVICTGYTVSSGDETLTVIVSGDATGDGESDSADAATVLRYDSGAKELDEAFLRAGDVSGDGETDSSDAMLILRSDAG